MEDAANLVPPKRLLFFFDGTAASAAEGRWADATNVFRMNLALEYKGNQIAFYMPGVGTRGDALSTVTARGMAEIVREGYVNLSSNVVSDDDQIYIFGYSRGAAAAIALTEIVSEVGLLWADHLDNLHAVWDYYLGHRGRKKLTGAERGEIWKTRIEGKVDRGQQKPQIRFLGLFDPVLGNGWDILTSYPKLRLTGRLPCNADHVVSILSIDDNRHPSYQPVLLSGQALPPQSVEQIWMPGVHADIGGNSDAVFLSDIALLTMIERAKTYCPELIWDDGYISRRETDFGERDSVEVSDERFDWKRKLLFKKDRAVGSTSSDGRARFLNETLHPVFDTLDGKEFWVRSRWRRYAPFHVPRSLPRFSTSYDTLFQKGCTRALKNTTP